MVVVGTRPEAIKMAPVIRELHRRPDAFETTVLSTGQHREMLDQVFRMFAIRPDMDLELMTPDQGLTDLASRSLIGLSRVFAKRAPQLVLVQGDTVTVEMAALAARYHRIRVGHVEAGLRSHDPDNPFPEEINRRVTSVLADHHFAPTALARENLLRENISAAQVFVTGNTVVDALRSIPLDGPFDEPRLNRIAFDERRVILVTAHRRENHGAALEAICQALRAIATAHEDVEIVFPVHMNPHVRGPVAGTLGGVARIHLVQPVSYVDLLRLIDRSYLILSDSGGIQEEAPSFHTPILILREVTERPEVVASGAGRLVGTARDRIIREVGNLLADSDLYRGMSSAPNPFGDGRAAERIVEILLTLYTNQPASVSRGFRSVA